MKSSRPPLPYLASNSATASCAARATKVMVPAAGSRSVTPSEARPSRLPNSVLRRPCSERDVADHRFGRVVDAAALALGRVVLREESLVEVNDGIAALAFVVVAVQDAGRVGHGQDFGDVVHAPGELLGQIAERDEAEDVAQDTDGVRDVVKRGTAAEAVPGPGRAAKRP